MSAIYSTNEQLAAMVAAAAAVNGARRAAFLTSWQTALGVNPVCKLYRNNVEVWAATHTGLLPIVGTAFVIEDASQTTITAADIDTGVWEFRVEKAGDATVYLGHTVTRAGGADDLSLDADLDTTCTIGTITLNAPDLDTDQPASEQSSSLVTGSNVGSIELTLSTQPTAGNKIVIPFAYYEGFRGYTDPTSVGATVVLDPSDLSSLRPNVNGTGTISAAGETVRRINNKGSAGGYLQSATGWVLRQTVAGAYYLEMSGTTEFYSSFAASSAISAAAGEVIVACRPDSSYSGGDSWYSGAIWQAGDGRAGVTIQSSTSARAFNRVATDTYHTLTHVLSSDQLFTWQHASGYVTGAVGFLSTLPTGTASTDTTNLTTPFAIGGVYHGSFPRLSGRFYGLVAKNVALSTTERDFVQWYLHRKMTPTASLAAPSVTDNAGNTYTLLASKADSAGKLLAGVIACHNVAAGTGTFTMTMSFGGSAGYYPAAIATEWSGLVGATALDQTADGTNDASAGSLGVTTSTTTQEVELVISAFGVHNADADVNMVVPSGYTQLGTHDAASTLVGFNAGYKIATAIGTQAATGTWDAGSAGGAAGVVVTLKAGVNTDPPSGGGGGADETFTLNLLKQDVNRTLAHEMFMDGVPPDWSWGTYCRPGTGANPPSATGWTAPAWVPWGHIATERNNPPGTHNWRVAIFNIYHAEKRNGAWAFTGTQVTSPTQINGSMYLDYETNESVAADTRTSNGYLEIKPPTTGGAYHWFPSFRTPISATGATHRAVLIQMSLTMDNPGGTDDRSAARVVALCGGDYWKSMTQAWDPAVYSNDDFWIGRAKKPAVYPDKSWHSVHTMTSDADINEFIAWVETLGILD